MSTMKLTMPRVVSKTMGRRIAIRRLKAVIVSVAVFALLIAFLSPLMYGLSMSLKTDEQIASQHQSVTPQSPATISYQEQDLPLYQVPLPDGTVRELAILEKTRVKSTFVDPQDLNAAPIEWEGSWRTLEPVWKLDVQWQNYSEAWTKIDFFKILMNTLFYAIVSTIGTLISSSLVAYGFARFSFPGKKVLFVVVMGTIILPPAVTTIPTYAFFHSIGWTGSWLPLLVPTFFANAYNIFLLRQFFMGIPKELDEAAWIDGAGALGTFIRVILPQAVPGLVAVALFNFFFCWNDFLGPMIYLAGKPDLQPITLGLASFNNQYTTNTSLVMAASMIACAIPLAVFALSQRFFMQGVVVTGVEK